MSTAIDTDPETPLATLVTFRYGAASVARYTSWADPIVAGDDTFTPEPSIVPTLNKQTGGSTDVPARLRMFVRPPLDTLTSQRTHSPVDVTIEEISPGDPSTRRVLFRGMARLSTRNIDNKSGVVELEIAGWRQSLEIMTNPWLANTTCNNVFGDGICGQDLAAIQETATISAVDGNDITLTGLTTTATDGYWRFGSVTFDGLSIKVREYTTGSILTLLKTPPVSWLGEEVLCTPGCDKRVGGGCKRFSREARFTGFGIRIPPYNPLLEAP